MLIIQNEEEEEVSWEMRVWIRELWEFHQSQLLIISITLLLQLQLNTVTTIIYDTSSISIITTRLY